jgi:hypothetical protein
VRELHVVALSEDGRSVVLATTKDASTGGFRVALDAKLAAALRGDLPRPGEQVVRDSTLTPKEIQSRLRAGESPEQIAADAGVAVARVERFAGPVLSERERVIAEARAAHVTRGRRGRSLLPLGDAVASALAETSALRPESVGWTARRLESGHWLVQVSYTARARARTGSWVYDPSTRSVTASDPASAALGHIGGAATPKAALPVARRRTPPEPVATTKGGPAKRAAPAAKAAPAGKAPAKKTPATKMAPAKKATATKATATKAPATKAAPAKKAPVRKAPATKAAPAKKAPVKKAPVKKAKVTKAPATRAAPVRAIRPAVPAAKPPATSARRTAPTRRARLEAVPDLRVVPTPPGATTPAPTRRAGGAARASVPAWADVLLSASPTTDRTED